MSQKPTSGQLELLKKLRIPAPTTKTACDTLLDYIFQDKNEREKRRRIRQVRNFHKRFTGARVKIIDRQNTHYGEYGQVEYLRMRSREERERIKQDLGNENPSLYTLQVELEAEEDVCEPEPVKQKVCTLVAPSQVKVCNPGNQLFFLF